MDLFEEILANKSEESQLKRCQQFINRHCGRVVVKLDGLEGGKGVKIFGKDLHTKEEVFKWCDSCLLAGKNFLLEELLVGREFSLISITDGKHAIHLPPVVDFKPLNNGNTGPNTGSMGSILDMRGVHFLSVDELKEAEGVNNRVIQSLREENFGELYKGFLYGSFMKTEDGTIKVIEFNCRLGDPEGVLLLEQMKIFL